MLRVTTHFAVVLAITLGTTSARASDDASPQAMAEARKHFQAGVNLLDDPEGAKYEEAYSAFKKAYELWQSPRVLGNLGFCAMHLERDGEAIDAYSKYLSAVPDVPERERAQIAKDVATMTSTVARIHIVVKRPGTHYILVDTRAQTRGPSIENTYTFDGNETTIGVRPGRHILKVKTDSSEAEESIPLEAVFEPGARETRELSFAPPKAAAPVPVLVKPSPPSVAGPVIVAITGVLAVGGGVTMGFLARSKANAIADKCPNDVCPTDYDLRSARTSAKTFGTIADVGMASGGALLLGALTWYVLLPSARTTTMAMCTGDGCSVSLGRTF